MTETVTVEIPLDVARSYARNYTRAEDVNRAVKKALPVEYPDGTIAWVTDADDDADEVLLAVRYAGAWRRSATRGGVIVIRDRDVTKVEVIPVAGEDEIVVPEPSVSKVKLLDGAAVLDRNYFYSVGEFLRSVANRL